jgi:hypothetical protein
MRFTVRRAAMLAASIALNAFFMLSPAGTAPVLAARCQQECDAEYSPGGPCDQQCDYQYFHQVGDGVSYDDWQACHAQCRSWYTSCSMSAVNCFGGSGEWQCFSCYTITWWQGGYFYYEIQCGPATGSAEETSYCSVW